MRLVRPPRYGVAPAVSQGGFAGLGAEDRSTRSAGCRAGFRFAAGCGSVRQGSLMKAAILSSPKSISLRPLEIAQAPVPELRPGHVLIRVREIGVCRTDLHIVEGELPPRRQPLIPGHQIVGRSEEHTSELQS